MNFVNPGGGQLVDPLVTTQLAGRLSQFIRLFADLTAQQAFGKQAGKKKVSKLPTRGAGSFVQLALLGGLAATAR